MEIARRDQLIQQYKHEIEHQKKVLHDRYNKIKGFPNPTLRDLKEEYKSHFEYMDKDVNKHNRQLNHILSYINGMLEEDIQNIDLTEEKNNILKKKKEFEQLKLSLDKILR